MHRILDSTSELELKERTKNLPEVQTYLAVYRNASWYINTDYHIGVDYLITQCEYDGKRCGEAAPAKAELEIVMSLDSGYPDHSHFWCDGNDHGKAPVANENVIQAIKECG